MVVLIVIYYGFQSVKKSPTKQIQVIRDPYDIINPEFLWPFFILGFWEASLRRPPQPSIPRDQSNVALRRSPLVIAP